MKLHAIIALLLAVLLAGCGGGGSDSPGTGLPLEPEWVFTPANTSTLGVWSKDNAGSNFGGVSAVLKGNGQVQIITTGSVTGLAGITGTVTGPVNAGNGSFDITGGGIRVTGVIGHIVGVVTVSRVGEPDITVEMNVSTTPAASYSAYKGVWTGTYAMSDEIDHAITFTVNEAGFITGSITDGLAAGTLYGRVDEESGEITLSIPYVDATPGWKFTTMQVQDGSVTGTVTCHDLADDRTGTWTANKE